MAAPPSVAPRWSGPIRGRFATQTAKVVATVSKELFLAKMNWGDSSPRGKWRRDQRL